MHQRLVGEHDESSPAVHNTTAALARSWHAVAVAAHIDERPRRVTLLGQDWVLARVDDELVALADRCPHRLAPLSIGSVCGSALRCRHHGWEFDRTGACVGIPALGPDAAVSPRARVPAAAGVTERYGLVWLAPTDPVVALPDLPEWDDPTFSTAMNAPRRTVAGAAQLIDNFLDAAHLPTVHTSTFGVADAGYLPPAEVVRDGWRAHATFEVLYKNHDDPLVATGEHPLVQPQVLYKEVAGPTVAVVRLGFPLTGRTITFVFACTPESATSTCVYKLMARDDLADPVDQLPPLLEFEDRVLDEDLDVLESYPHRDLATDLRTEVHTRADRLSVAYRRILADLVAL